MLILVVTALLSLPESTGVSQWLFSALQLPSAGTEMINQQNIKLALQVLGLLAGLPEGIKQSVTQSMGMQALQYSWWWNKTGKAHWEALRPKLIRVKAWLQGLPKTQVTIAWQWSSSSVKSKPW